MRVGDKGNRPGFVGISVEGKDGKRVIYSPTSPIGKHTATVFLNAYLAARDSTLAHKGQSVKLEILDFYQFRLTLSCGEGIEMKALRKAMKYLLKEAAAMMVSIEDIRITIPGKTDENLADQLIIDGKLDAMPIAESPTMVLINIHWC
ncbi:MAG: hypothetical protein PHG97_01395 [Candidatus Margulisbacteria bacterium]|nr:hypothetical protein [Candidatus Margulisiibacteriota bacterium]